MSAPGPGVEPRIVATRIVGRVLRRGAYSNVAVRTMTEGLEPGDRRLATALAYGVLRHLLRIDRTIRLVGDRDPDALDDVVADVLRVGVEDLCFTGSAPHAAVDTAVETVRALGMGRAAGLVNAILRRVARAGEPPLPPGIEGRALEVSVPRWLYAQVADGWERHLGLDAETAHAFWTASQRPPRAAVRVRPGGAPPPGAEPVDGIPGAYLLADMDPRLVPEATPVDAPAADDGWVFQDPASVAVGLAVAPPPGATIADLAAAPGGKTLHLVDLAGPDAVIVAADAHRRRATSARRRLRRLGVDVPWIVADARRPPLRDGRFDRILLDAPCSGLGTLRRRPEIRYRLTPDRIEELAALQKAMVAAARPLLAPDGVLAYAVCTVTADETVLVTTDGRPPDIGGQDLGVGRLLAPHLGPTDGMYVSCIDGPAASTVRRSEAATDRLADR